MALHRRAQLNLAIREAGRIQRSCEPGDGERGRVRIADGKPQGGERSHDVTEKDGTTSAESENRGTVSRREFLGAAATVSVGTALGSRALRGSLQRSRDTTDARDSVSTQQTLTMWSWEELSQWDQVYQQSGVYKKFPGLKITFLPQDINTLQQKAITALASGVSAGLPNLLRIPMATYRALVNTKAIVDTTKDVTPYKDDILATTWGSLNVDGRTYALPDDTGFCLFGYRWDLFSKAGIGNTPAEVAAAIPTYDDLLTVGQKLKAKTGSMLMLFPQGVDGIGSPAPFTTMVMQGSTGFFDPDGNVILDSPYHIAVGELYQKMYKSGLMANISGTVQQWAAYKTGELATIPYPNWQDFEFVAYTPNLAYKWQVVPLPTVTAGSKQIATADGCAIVLPAGQPSDQLQLAIQVGLYLKLNQAASEAHMRVFSGAFESCIPALQAMKGTKSPMLKGQEVYNIWLPDVQTLKPYPISYASVFGPQMGTAVNNAIYSITADNKPVAATLKSAADGIRQLQDEKGLK
jgi:multiple sugar transport system substrate-binding protein